MGLLPFDDWFYNLTYRKSEVVRLHRDVVGTEADIYGRDAALRGGYTDLLRMTAFNGMLSLALAAITLDDAAWRAHSPTATPSPAIPDAFSGDDVLAELTAVVGAAAVARFQQTMAEFKVGDGVLSKLLSQGAGFLVKGSIKTAVGNFVTGLVVVEAEAGVDAALGAATLVGIEAATWGTIAATGVGIVIGLGFDIIFDAISGAVAKAELDKQIDQLQSALDKLQAFRDRQAASAAEISKAIGDQRAAFTPLLAQLALRDSPDFTIEHLTANSGDAAVLKQQRSAVRRFGQFFVLRDAVARAAGLNKKVTADAILDALMIGAPAGVTRMQLLWYWDVLATMDSGCAAMRPTWTPELVCATVEARVSAALVAPFRVGWIDKGGNSGVSPWSGNLSLLQSEQFDLAALKVPPSAQVRVEAHPVGGDRLVSHATAWFAGGSPLQATFVLRGNLFNATLDRDDS